MKWIKKGLIIRPRRDLDWMLTHAWVPFAERLTGDNYRIYFAGRNNLNLSQTGFVEIDINRPHEVLNFSKRPAFELGALGTFDDSAVIPSWIVNEGGEKYLYYIGWMQGKRVPYYASLGLAFSPDGGQTFQRHSRGPLLERNDIDPYMTASACVRREGNRWRMWYLTNTQWTIENGEPRPKYHIKYAESPDGIHWERKGIVSIDFESEQEYAISRPCVLQENGIYKMWYSHRGENYRIGYAESADGIVWERLDHRAGIDVSASGWDSKMIEYPFVFEHDGAKYMLYNGNDFGREGIGLAVLDK